MQAQGDGTSGGVTVDFSTSPVINTVSITAPSAGFITVMGQAFDDAKMRLAHLYEHWEEAAELNK